MPSIQDLYQTLDQRKRPEDVAEMILELLQPDLDSRELQLLNKAASGSLKRIQHHYTSMLEGFSSVVGASRQMKKVMEVFRLRFGGQEPDYNYPPAIAEFIQKVSPIIHKTPGKNDFTHDRLNKSQRAAQGLDISKRIYNKKWRLLKRLEAKLVTVLREYKKLDFQKIGKHGLARQISYEAFAADLNSACFIAYITARGNLRSEFTINGQQRSFDEIADMLLKRCEARPTSSNWYAISFVHTGQRIVKFLTDQQKGELLGKWTTTLQQLAAFLQELWNGNKFNKQTMIVKRGDDSTTWNNTASAWNKARDNWINLVYSMGMESILDEICFGKAMRLMAGDVAYWHKVEGGKLDPNTEVWNQLPLPWEVFSNDFACTRSMVIDACKAAGIDPEKSGWIAPRQSGIAKFRPTPELVHGVTITNPFLATVLKKHKYFSGKDINPLYPELN